MTIHHDPYLTDDGIAVVPSQLGNVSREALEESVKLFAARIGELREAMYQMAGFVHDLRKVTQAATSAFAAPDSLPSPETRPPSGRMCGSREHQAPLTDDEIAKLRERTRIDAASHFHLVARDTITALLDEIEERRRIDARRLADAEQAFREELER